MANESTEVKGIVGLLARVLEKNGPAWFLLMLIALGIGYIALGERDRLNKHMDDAGEKLGRMTAAIEQLVEKHSEERQAILTEISRCCPVRVR